MHGVREVDLPGLPDRAADGCLARAAKEGGRMITVGEYIAWRQPGILDILENWRRVESHPLQWWARLMTERPLPGESGVTPGGKGSIKKNNPMGNLGSPLCGQNWGAR